MMEHRIGNSIAGHGGMLSPMPPPDKRRNGRQHFREYFPPLAFLSSVPPTAHLVIAYNAGNGLFNALNDWAHKIFSPATYECRLCHFTYGLTGMLRPWKAFLESVPHGKRFLHRNEFHRAYPAVRVRLPAILAVRGESVFLLVSAGELEALGSLDQLIALMRERLALWDEGRLEPLPAAVSGSVGVPHP
ncbi:MAG: hypothetical protein FD161_3953 [Limisphaerales bacterium]|nr:MAG: hypothetical protein FD161_3953 [Limisphaerales bacterium]TXT45661.1 MAG: hypothetical protein FD140_4628 [Limisphaerales bacterium]